MKLIALTLLLLVTLNLAYADSNSNSRVDCENSYLDCDTVKDTLICDMDKTTFVACGMVDCDGSMSNSDYVKCLKNCEKQLTNQDLINYLDTVFFNCLSSSNMLFGFTFLVAYILAF